MHKTKSFFKLFPFICENNVKCNFLKQHKPQNLIKVKEEWRENLDNNFL